MMTEADLVKYHRGEAFDLLGTKSANNKPNGEKNKDAVRDVVLQRAVDILKGIPGVAVVAMKTILFVCAATCVAARWLRR
ncbi:MAG: hypothetical protein MZV49_05455 [Rhodopseudomonas palustris]|nr:hypothetical protein [Rhodopseudomonas palustris]